jgi:hypothetical protein
VDLGRVQSHLPVTVTDLLWQHPRRQVLGEHDSVGIPVQLPYREAVLPEPEQIPLRACAEQQVN